MADLRGQQLKDSYHNVVTRGTGGNVLEDGNGEKYGGTMAGQEADDVDITGGSIVGVSTIAVRGVQDSLFVSDFIRRKNGTNTLGNGGTVTIDISLSNSRSGSIHINAKFIIRSGNEIYINHRVIVAAIDGGIDDQSSVEIIGISASDYPIAFSHVSGDTYRITATNNSGSTRFQAQLVCEISTQRDLPNTA